MLAAYRFLIGTIEQAIVTARSSHADEAANLWRAGQTLLKSVVAELRMWILLKEGDGDSAWRSFCDAEDYAVLALRWSPDNFAPARDQVEHLGLVEKVVFPEQPFFVSTTLIVGREICTICEADYGSCNHLVGELYAGDMCVRRCEEIKDILSISLVKNPADKRNRIRSATDTDPLTGEPPKRPKIPPTKKPNKKKRRRRK